MATTHNNGSTKSLGAVAGRHDGHQDGHLNCVALRHGWSRAFSISPSEVPHLTHDQLETILEITTLKLRPMGVRVYIENPPASNQWQKVKYWKLDNSLQSTLILEFFERRRVSGTVTRFDIRDGSAREGEGGDGLSLRTVGSIVLRRNNSGHIEGREVDRPGTSASTSRPGPTRWFSLSRNTSMRSRTARTAVDTTDVEDEGHVRSETEDERVPPIPPKVSTPPSANPPSSFPGGILGILGRGNSNGSSSKQ